MSWEFLRAPVETWRLILERGTKELRCFRAAPQAGDDGWAGDVAVPVQINPTSLNQTQKKRFRRKVFWRVWKSNFCTQSGLRAVKVREGMMRWEARDSLLPQLSACDSLIKLYNAATMRFGPWYPDSLFKRTMNVSLSLPVNGRKLQAELKGPIFSHFSHLLFSIQNFSRRH